MGTNESPGQNPDEARCIREAAESAFPTQGGIGSRPELTQADKQYLLNLARDTIRHALGVGKMPEFHELLLPPALNERRSCFVTLLHNGELRGCIGQIFPQGPLYRSVIDSARGAALRDPRFPTMQAWELAGLNIEISALSEPKKLTFCTPEELLDGVRQKLDGVVLRVHGRTTTFLPQVWEQFGAKEQFLDKLCQKAGLDSRAWRGNDIEVFTYEAEFFAEQR